MIKSLIQKITYALSGRNPRWATVEKNHLSTQPNCQACGTTKRLQVHHMKPFHLFPEKELDNDNLITLCMDEWQCHIRIGHSGDWRAYNPHVIDDAATQLARIKERKYAS